jgi:gentisate 1,2-dioxygenase
MKTQSMKNTTETNYLERGRYFTLDQGFNTARTPVPAHIFLSERDTAFLANGASAHILCDQSSTIGGDVPATAPLLLASYIRLKPGAPLGLRSGGSAEIFYVIQGAGTLQWPDGLMHWQTGDVMLFPGGVDETLTALGDGNAVLWRCTNEPQLAYEGALPVPAGQSAIKPTRYEKSEMMKALAEAKKLTMKNGMKSMAIMLGTENSKNGTITPSLTLALNCVPAHDSQVPHRHNSVAVTLVLEGENCHSMVEAAKVPWSRYATFVTPATASHSHHNQADADALLLIVQDGGLYAHCRTMGFAITSNPPA